MDKLRSWFTISQLVTGGPILLLLLLSLVLGVSFYSIAYEDNLKHSISEARVGAQPIAALMNRSVGGGNYANVQDESAINLYKANDKLRFFSVEGRTDLGGESYGVMYDAGLGRVVRSAYGAGYKGELEEKISRARETLTRLEPDHGKRPAVERMLNEQQAELRQYEDNLRSTRELMDKYRRPPAEKMKDGYYLDTEKWVIHMVLATGNSGGGEIWMVVDASQIATVGKEILADILPANILTLVLCVALAMLLSRTINRPIRRMAQAIDRIERDSDLTLRLEAGGRDEIAQVGMSLNRMLEKFQALLREVSESSEQVASSAELMSNSICETNAGIETQKHEAHQLATSSNEMMAAVNEVANSANIAAQSASDANVEAEKGMQEVKATIDSITTLAREVENSAAVIAALNREAESIGSVLDVIKSIAQQTNLLALNAAIEAARAGEHGRGFAVVADEVRTLAQRTQESTEEIEDMIGRLQSGAHNAVQSMKTGKERSESCVEQARHAGAALGRINEAVDRISSMNAQIASSAEEQTAVTDEIGHHIHAISDISDQNATNADHCSRTSEELAQLAVDLQSKVTRFKV